MQLDGRKVLVTGAAGGLGRAIAHALAARGATLVLSGRKGADLKKLAEVLPGSGHTVAIADLAEEGAALSLLASVGDLDALVANAGLPGSGRLESFSQDEIGRALRVNLESPMRMTRELLPAWQQRGHGHFVYVASISGFAAAPQASVYAATKFGLRGFALNLREDLRGSGIGASLVSPGMIRDAGMFAEAGVPAPAGLGTGTPEQVGRAVVDAIERNRGEVVVAPIQQRAVGRFSMLVPELAGRIANSSATKAAEKIAATQAHKR
jgi:short-subunit dehydrogenase